MKILFNISLVISCLFLVSFVNLRECNIELNVRNLSKKWNLDKYTISWYSENPSKKEKNDYIKLNENMTFTSISEGVFERGKWQLQPANKRLILSKKEEKGNLKFFIEKLSEDELILIIDDVSDPEAKYLNIHFKN